MCGCIFLSHHTANLYRSLQSPNENRFTKKKRANLIAWNFIIGGGCWMLLLLLHNVMYIFVPDLLWLGIRFCDVITYTLQLYLLFYNLHIECNVYIVPAWQQSFSNPYPINTHKKCSNEIKNNQSSGFVWMALVSHIHFDQCRLQSFTLSCFNSKLWIYFIHLANMSAIHTKATIFRCHRPCQIAIVECFIMTIN